MSIIKRGGVWQLVKRVPVRFQGIDGRRQVWISLQTDSLSVAKLKAPQAWQDMVAAWEAKLADVPSAAETHFRAAREIAARKGYHYVPGDAEADFRAAREI